MEKMKGLRLIAAIAVLGIGGIAATPNEAECTSFACNQLYCHFCGPVGEPTCVDPGLFCQCTREIITED